MGKVIDVLTCKCPKCKKGKMFNNLGNLLLFRMSKMNTICNVCNFKFEKEPGFFFGAIFSGLCTCGSGNDSSCNFI